MSSALDAWSLSAIETIIAERDAARARVVELEAQVADLEHRVEDLEHEKNLVEWARERDEDTET